MSAAGDRLAPVRGYLGRAAHAVVGLMTGTSADGVDAILVRFEGHGMDARHTIERYRETPLGRALRREVLAVAAAEMVAPERLMRLDAALGECYAAAVVELLAESGTPLSGVSAIGCHGQTVRHIPRAEGGGEAFTLQIGSAARLAERTGITVVSNFRDRDTAAGGEGAPLVPIADLWLFRSPTESRVLLNLGGMANVTYLPRGGGLADAVAFDTGPGNAVLDEITRLASGGAVAFDAGGAGAARGTADPAVLAELLADPFFALPPPRSTGRERFGADYAARLLERFAARGLPPENALATAVELTAASVANAVSLHLAPRAGVDTVFASGGGVRNDALMAALARRLAPARLEPLESLGVPAAAKEALAFAFLAHLTLGGFAGNVPGATGARRGAALGQITPGGFP